MGNILHTLPKLSFDPVLLLPFFDRTLLDNSVYGHTVNVLDPMKWASASGVDGVIPSTPFGAISIPDDPVLQLPSFSIFLYSRHGLVQTTDQWVVVRGTEIQWRLRSDRMRLHCSGVNSDIVGNYHGARSIAATLEAGNKPDFYVDSNHFGEGLAALTPTPGANATNLMGNVSLGMQVPSNLIVFYPGKIIQSEVSRLHTYCEALTSPSLPHNRAYFDMGSQVPNGNAGGEVGSWDLGRSTGRTEPDKSGGGNHATLVGPVMPVNTEIGRALKFDGTTGYIDLGGMVVPAGSFTLSMMVNSDLAATTLKYLLDSSAGRLIFAWFGATSGKLGMYDGAWREFGDAPIGGWHHIAFVLDADAGTSKAYVDGEQSGSTLAYTPTAIGGNTAIGALNNGTGLNFFEGMLGAPILANRAWSEAEVKAAYQPIRDKLLYKLELDQVPPGLAPSTAGEGIPGTDYLVGNGSFQVQEVASENYRKGIVCVTAGTRYRPQKRVAGTYHLELNRTTAAGDTYLNFIATQTVWNHASNNGYALRHRSTGDLLALVRITGGVSIALVGSDLALTRGVTYKFTITRTKVGLFTVYALGGVYTTWTQVITGIDATYSDSEWDTATHLADDVSFEDAQHLGVITP